MPYVTFETMENEETTNLAEKSTILDGHRVVVVSSSCRRRVVVVVVGGMWN